MKPPSSSHPADRDTVYVIKLHRDADPRGRLHGRVIHLASGAALRFDDAETLVAWLRRPASPSPDADS